MKAVAAVFTSRAAAERGAGRLQAIGIPRDRINFLIPEASQRAVAAVPTTAAEQPGMGKTIGAVVGGAVGVAGGSALGAAMASAAIPGVGPILAIGAAAAAFLGAGGAAAGAAAGEALEDSVEATNAAARTTKHSSVLSNLPRALACNHFGKAMFSVCGSPRVACLKPARMVSSQSRCGTGELWASW